MSYIRGQLGEVWRSDYGVYLVVGWEEDVRRVVVFVLDSRHESEIGRTRSFDPRSIADGFKLLMRPEPR